MLNQESVRGCLLEQARLPVCEYIDRTGQVLPSQKYDIVPTRHKMVSRLPLLGGWVIFCRMAAQLSTLLLLIIRT
jgi:hypothetical protein